VIKTINWLLRRFADSKKRSDQIEKALRLTKQVDPLATVGMMFTGVQATAGEDLPKVGQETFFMLKRSAPVPIYISARSSGLTPWFTISEDAQES
jgi:hypothetical protein